jgi:CDP-glucose 4,6-dehydratase
MAAQPLVQESYRDPYETYTVNFLGTLNVLELLKDNKSIRSSLIITTDKVYRNDEIKNYRYKEDDVIFGKDPYSNSKSICELVYKTYYDSFFSEKNVKVSSVRSGNVFGGGDFSDDRIVPDCFRAASKNETIKLRNPYSTRPYQHVLDPIIAYLLLLFEQEGDVVKCGAFNIGPDKGADNVPNVDLVSIFCRKWGLKEDKFIEEFSALEYKSEATFLSLDNSKIKKMINWRPLISLDLGIELSVDWYKSYLNAGDIEKLMNEQIDKVLYL